MADLIAAALGSAASNVTSMAEAEAEADPQSNRVFCSSLLPVEIRWQQKSPRLQRLEPPYSAAVAGVAGVAGVF